VALDVEHGRLGLGGEQTALAAALLRDAYLVPVGNRRLPVPPEERQLVLQGLERTCGRRRLRLADVAWTVARARDPRVDWDAVVADCRALGLEAGLSSYLNYVDQIYFMAVGSPLPCPAHLRPLLRGRWGRAAFDGVRYRFPAVAVTGRLLLGRFLHEVRSRHWAGAARLALILGGSAVTGVLLDLSRLLRSRRVAARPSTVL
jgi:hypothetical protein